MYSSNAALPTVGCSAARERRNSEKRRRCSVLPAATMRARTRVFAPHAARGWWVSSQTRQGGLGSAVQGEAEGGREEAHRATRSSYE